MPLDSDVFQVPHGYNAPQQVHKMKNMFLKIPLFGKIWILSSYGFNGVFFFLFNLRFISHKETKWEKQ